MWSDVMRTEETQTRSGTKSRRLWSGLVLVLALVFVIGTVACSELPNSTTTTTTAASSTGAANLASNDGTAAPAQTLESTSNEFVSPAEIVAAKVSASVVNVRVKGVTVSPFFGQEQYEGVGSGIIYTSDGYILTNDHVVSLNGQPAESVQVTAATGEVLDATIVARDATNDLALLKIAKTGLTPVVFAKSSTVAVGQWAIAIGSPLDYSNTVTVGIVSGLDRELETGNSTTPTATGLLQTDAAISPGNSGGGLFNAAGELIGMPEAYLPPQSTGAENIGFAIPSDKVAAIAEQLTSGQTTSDTLI
jgi:serine protease Do